MNLYSQSYVSHPDQMWITAHPKRRMILAISPPSMSAIFYGLTPRPCAPIHIERISHNNRLDIIFSHNFIKRHCHPSIFCAELSRLVSQHFAHHYRLEAQSLFPWSMANKRTLEIHFLACVSNDTPLNIYVSFFKKERNIMSLSREDVQKVAGSPVYG